METINHECYVSLEVAKLLKEAGFDWKCKAHYKQNGDFILRGYDRDWNATASINPNVEYYFAPILDVTQRWFREVKNISVDISSTRNSEWEYIIRKINQSNHNDNTIFVLTACRFYTYEEAQEAGIKNALKIILEND